MNKKANIHGENSTLTVRKLSVSVRARSLIRYCAGSDLKSAFLELYKDYLRIKSGFLPRSGCL